ncbi:MAG: hypothetical protein AB7E74_26440 [Pirellulales bacterium]
MNNPPKSLSPRLLNLMLAKRAKEALLAGDPRPIVELHWPGTILDDFQADLIGSMFGGQFCEVAVKGCAGAGKGAAVAIGINLWFTVSQKCTIAVVSPNLQHSQEVMFREIADWRRRMRHPGPGEIRSASLTALGKHLTLVNPTTKEGLSGRHGDNVLFVFDEATSIPEGFYNMALNQAEMIVAIGNPRTRSGWFRRLFLVHAPDETQSIPCRGKLRRCITISGEDCRNVREGRVVIPNQLTRERLAEIMAHPDLQYRRMFALAKFPTEDAQFQLIFGSWLDRHTSASFVPGNWSCCGLDPAASESGDESVLAIGNESGVKVILSTKIKSLQGLVEWTIEMARQHNVRLDYGHWITVDANGVGQGAAEMLKRAGAHVINFVGSERAEFHHLYSNRRAEGYGLLANRLNPNDYWGEQPWALPDDPLLLEELCAVERIMEADGVSFRLIPKERQREEGPRSLRDILGRSPDRADAVTYLWEAVRKYAAIANRPRRHAAYVPPDVQARIDQRRAMAPRPKTLIEYLGLDDFGPLRRSDHEPRRLTMSDIVQNIRSSSQRGRLF